MTCLFKNVHFKGIRSKVLQSILPLILLFHVNLFAQQTITVTGKVTGDGSDALYGVSVSVSGTTQVTTTDQNGSFTLNVPPNASLSFSFAGFSPQTVRVGGRNVIDVNLESDAKGLEEVVLTGYTAQRKKDITGAVSVVDVKALKTVPSGSVMQSLQGQAAGVNVINSGAPGEGSKIFIRGVSSLGNTDPLVLIDGVQGNLNNLSPDDVESVQVLKDAGAAAIYGSRGSNGVIVVTTKKGKAGTMQVSYDSWFNVQVPGSSNAFNMLNTEEYAREYYKLFPGTTLFPGGQVPDYLYRGSAGRGVGMEGDPAVDPARYKFDAQNPNNNYIIQKVNKSGTDMYSEVFNPALWMNHNVTASGGSERGSYLMSLGYMDHKGTLMNTWNKRYQVRVNTEYKLTKDIKVGQNMLAFYRNSRMLGNGSNATFNNVTSTRLWMPFLPVYDIAGNYGGTFAGPAEMGNWGNAVADQERTVNDRNSSYQINGNVYIDIRFLKNFTARSSFGGTVNNYYVQAFGFNGYNNNEGFNGTNTLRETSGYGTTAMWTNTLNYNNDFGKHGVNVIVGSESVENRGRQLQGQAMGFYSTDYNYLILRNGTSTLLPSNDYGGGPGVYENALFSLFSRVDYNYDDKYLLSGTIRRDGYSMFGANNKYGIFPSVSVGWRISQENFMRGIEWISDLKLRGSHGVLGNKENIGPNNPYSLYGQGHGRSYYDLNGSSIGAVPGFYPLSIGNPNTRWERNVLTNIGMDATLLNNSLDVSIEWYRKYIDGLLFGMQLPATVGEATRPSVNIGDVQNTGVDLSVTYRKRVNEKFNFSIGANIGTYKMLIKKLPDPGYVYYGEQIITQEGFASSTFYGYRVLGLFSDNADVDRHATQQDAAPGRFKFEDVNGDGAITPDDRTHLGNPHPDFTYGLNLTASYQKFDFSAIFYGSQGNDIYNATRSATDFWGSYTNKSRRVLNAWTEDNKNTDIPKAEAVRNFTNHQDTHSSYYIEDGSYLRLRALTVGYNIPVTARGKVGISNLRLYVQGTNLFTITKYSGLDPELHATNAMFFGQDNGNYPIQKSFVIGLNLGLK